MPDFKEVDAPIKVFTFYILLEQRLLPRRNISCQKSSFVHFIFSIDFRQIKYNYIFTDVEADLVTEIQLRLLQLCNESAREKFVIL